MPIGTAWVIGSVVIFSICGLGVNFCRGLMLDDLQTKIPEGSTVKYPYLSWKYREIIRLHRQYCPASRVRATSQVLVCIAVLVMGSLMLGTFSMVMLKSIPR